MDKPTTENSSLYDHLEQKSTRQLLEIINKEDQTVAHAVKKVIPRVEALVDEIVKRMQKGGRLFYIGAGTSGRLGIVDASECPPTFGVPHDWVIGLMAGGDSAIRKAVEFAEDDETAAWEDMKAFIPGKEDTVVGIAASGRTPYVVGGVKDARAKGLLTGCITNSEKSILASHVEHPIEVITGPEVVTGSTRMKSGTAQKLVLNMISTAVMIRLGRVQGNRMVDMQLSNNKLVSRGIRMIMEELNVTEKEAAQLLERHGSVRAAIKK